MSRPPSTAQPFAPPADDTSERLLDEAARLGAFGAWSLDLVTGVTTWSEELDEIRGIPWTRECRNDQVLQLYAPESHHMLIDTFTACVHHGTPFDVEAQVVGEGGRRTWLRVIGVAIRDVDGRVMRVQGAYQDIQKSRAAIEKYRALAGRFRTTLDSLLDGFAIIDREWRVNYVNPAGAAMLGVTLDQAVGASYWELFPQARGTVFEQNYTQAMHEGQPQRFEAYYAPLKMWFRISAFPSEEGLAISFSDVTAVRREHEALLEMNAELERRVRLRTEELEAVNSDLKAFSYSIAHDLRSPLGTIAGYAQALEESKEQRLGERSTHYLRRIRAAAGKMDAMTDAILALFRVASADIHRHRVDLADIARDCVRNLRAGSPARRVQVKVAPSLPVEADPALIALVMQNLLSNAWKYSSQQPEAAIEVGAREGPGGQREYFVRDNGVGFEQEQSARVFEPFSRLHGQGFEGSGIGLATVHRIIARHGGRVWADAAPQQGATFYFVLG